MKKRKKRRYRAREDVEALLTAFIMAIVLRHFVIEPFQIPTGSMAPTLRGNHRETTCPNCGYRFAIGRPSPDEPHSYQSHKACPNCEHKILLRGNLACPGCGDYVGNANSEYSFRSDTERFDCQTCVRTLFVRGSEEKLTCPGCRARVSFGDLGYPAGAAGPATCPHCDAHFYVATPQTVKLMPSQRYTRAVTGEDGGDRIVVNKFYYSTHPIRRWDVVVFKFPENPSMNYIKRCIGMPGDRNFKISDGDIWIDGKRQRKPERVWDTLWLPFYSSRHRFSKNDVPWKLGGVGMAAKSSTVTAAALSEAEGGKLRSGDLGTWRTAVFSRDIADYYGYNNSSNRGEHAQRDFKVAFRASKRADGAFALSMLEKGNREQKIDFIFNLAEKSDVTVRVVGEDADTRAVFPITITRQPGRRELEIAAGKRDGELFVVQNGVFVCRMEYEPYAVGKSSFEFRFDGSDCAIEELEVRRDIYYVEGTHSYQSEIPAGSYFMLGDNQPSSQDSRSWNNGPFVPESHIVGKPLFIFWPLSRFRYIR